MARSHPDYQLNMKQVFKQLKRKHFHPTFFSDRTESQVRPGVPPADSCQHPVHAHSSDPLPYGRACQRQRGVPQLPSVHRHRQAADPVFPGSASGAEQRGQRRDRPSLVVKFRAVFDQQVALLAIKQIL